MTRKLLNILRRDARGAAVLELALIAPVVAITVAGIVDISSAYSRKLALEQGVQRAIEKIMQTTEDTTVEGTLASEAVCQVNGTNADGTCKTSPITTANITITYRMECTNSGTGAVTSNTTTDADTYNDWEGCSAGYVTSRYISVTATDQYTPMFPIHFSNYNSSDGTYHLSATAGMRTA
ncbi:TadE/TadG family type IV pilus assembly protein [Sphingomonas sp. ASV193]|uniref:TadE/TadG family type IV pilus assembly protein n=1 Tax=Sphingomonas sp. ASV193 TaxID=3144405 RepID=UPI0032E87501